MAGNTDLIGAGRKGAWVFKLNENGNWEWNHILGGSRDDEVYAVQTTSDGGYVVAGYTTSKDFID